jgi:hypothetical protein
MKAKNYMSRLRVNKSMPTNKDYVICPIKIAKNRITKKPVYGYYISKQRKDGRAFAGTSLCMTWDLDVAKQIIRVFSGKKIISYKRSTKK